MTAASQAPPVATPLSIEAFVSYAWQNPTDQDDVTLLVQEMRLRGMLVFRDREALSEGASIEDAVAAALARAHVYLPYLTPESLSSVPVRTMEFVPARQRRADGELEIVVVARRLGSSRDAVAKRVWTALGYDLTAAWTGVYPGRGRLSLDQAGQAANEALKAALRVVDTEAPLRLTVSTHGHRLRPRGLYVDATETLGGNDRVRGTPSDWSRLLHGLRDLNATLLATGEAGAVEVSLKCHLAAALLTGWVFRSSAGWDLIAVQNDLRMGRGRTGGCDEVTVTVENGAFGDGGTLVVQLGLIRQIEAAVSTALAKGAPPRRRLRFAQSFPDGEIPSSAMGDIGLKIAREIKQHVDHTSAARVQIFAAAPAAALLHLGAHLGAMPPITVFEFHDGSYHAALELPAS